MLLISRQRGTHSPGVALAVYLGLMLVLAVCTSEALSKVAAPAPAIKISPLVENLALSKTIEMHALTMDMKRAGKDVLSLCVGEPDYQPPQAVIDATGAAATLGNTKYTAVTGENGLRAAIATDLLARKGTAYTAEQIVVSNGAKQAVMQALMTVVTPGETVLIPAPYWTSYPDMVQLCNAKPVIVSTSAADSYTLTPQVLRAALEQNPSTSCLILCNPSNPSGCVADKEMMGGLVKVLLDFPQVAVISDEIYEHLVYDVEHVSMSAMEGMMDRTVVINGFSKSHSMTGYRVGYAAAPPHIAKAMGKLQSQFTSCASSVSQYAALKALESSKEGGSSAGWMKERVAELKDKRDLAYGMLREIPGITCPEPKGAFYLLPDVSAYYGKTVPATADSPAVKIEGGHQLCLALLRTRQVALVAGDAFGVEECIRLSYATSKEVISESIFRLKDFLLTLE